MKNKILVVAAHPDDEILGVGGTIIKYANCGDEVRVLILADGESSRAGGEDVQKREGQARKAAEILGIKEIIMEKLPDNGMDQVPLLEITKTVEKIVYDYKPEIIYTHCPNDLNIDHRLTFQAVMTCCRPQPGFFVKKILAFETLSSTEWQIKDSSNAFCPTVYANIGKEIEKKLEALKVYQDELRDYPHPRSLEGVKILAQYRGMEVGYKYAEAFQLIRSIKK